MTEKRKPAPKDAKQSKKQSQDEATTQSETPSPTKPEGYVFGRPTLYKPEFCEQIKEFGKDGYSQEEMAAALGICMTTFERWEKEYPDFKGASMEAYNFSLAWWERASRKGVWYNTANGPRMDAGLFATVMSARFPKKYRASKETKDPQDLSGLPDDPGVSKSS